MKATLNISETKERYEAELEATFTFGVNAMRIFSRPSSAVEAIAYKKVLTELVRRWDAFEGLDDL